jgi:hypothetical protein
MSEKTYLGLREQIANAKTKEEVLSLVQHGQKNFHSASVETKSSWRNTAKTRITQLETVSLPNNEKSEKSEKVTKKSHSKSGKKK